MSTKQDIAITRGTTNTNRLRRVDRWIGEQAAFRHAADALVVDLGYGASGVTTFEQLTGRVQLTPEKSHFFNVLINSGLMQSTGYVDVAKNNKLNGRFELQMKGSANQTRVPVAIDGTLDSPRVQAMH